MVPEDHPFVRGYEITAILQSFCRSRTLPIERKNFRSDELTVEAIADRIRANRCCDQPQRADLLAAMQSHRR